MSHVPRLRKGSNVSPLSDYFSEDATTGYTCDGSRDLPVFTMVSHQMRLSIYQMSIK